MPKTSQAKLIMAANSLGQPGDIPLRSLEALRTSDLLIFEEDKPARQALKAAGVHRDYLKLTEHNEKETVLAASAALKAGKVVCYMSDQGMPTLADPGQLLLHLAYQHKSTVTVIPGPSSISTALAACPFPVEQFFYQGFLPREKSVRHSAIAKLVQSQRVPIVILETPYRRKQLLQSLAAEFSETTKALLAVDISGPNENYYYDDLKTLAALDLEKLNFVVVVNPGASRRPFIKRGV